MFGQSGGAAQKSSPAAWVTPAYTGLQLPTSCESLPVPLVYGMTKVSINIIYTGNFQTHQQLAWTGSVWIVTGYTYTSDFLFALCEGPISNVNQVWQNSSVALFSHGSPNPNGFSLGYWGVTNGKGASGAGLFDGAPGQAPWSYLSTHFPAYALAYQGLAYVACPNFGVGANAAVGTLNFEPCAILYGTGANGIDADPAQVIEDFLTDPSHGVPSFPTSALDTTTLLGSSGDASVQSYCAALGLCFSPALVQQETANSVLTRWCQLLNLGAVWAGGKLRFIPYGDMQITGSTVNFVPNVTPVYSLTYDHFLAAGGEVNGAEGSPVVVDRSDPLTLFNVQRLEVLNRAGINVNVALCATRLAASQTQMISLLTHGVEPGQGINAPVQGQPQYQATPIEARDLNTAQVIGVRFADTIQAHEICDLNVASIVAQTILQRGLYIRNHYSFTVSFVFCLLDPMDIIALTDPFLGLNGALVRITQIEENDDGSLKITAEELVIGVSTPGPNPTTGTGSTTTNQNVVVDLVQSACIYQPPTAATGGVSQLWICAAGGLGGVPDPNFGGADVDVSVDGGTTYNEITTTTSNSSSIGTLSNQSLTTNAATASGAVLHFASVPSSIVAGLPVSDATTSGVIPAGALVQSTTSTSVTLTANVTGAGVGASNVILFGGLALTTGWDTTQTLSVTLSQSNGALTSTTAANAQAGAANLAVIGSELIGFQTATLTGNNSYNLSGLQRGLFGTTAAAHAAGSQFALMSAATRITIQAGWSSLYLKLPAFNIWGNGQNALVSCYAIPFTVGSTGVATINTVSETVSLSGSSVTTSDVMGQILSGATLLSVTVTAESTVTGATGIYVDPQFLANGSAGGSAGAYGTCGVSSGSSVTYTTSGTSWTVNSGMKLTATGGGGSFTGGSAMVGITYLIG